MKDFKDNLDEDSIDEAGTNRFAEGPTSSHTFAQRALHLLSRYSLLIIVGLAALSITVLHFQGRYLLQALQGTPLPTFWLEKIVGLSAVPDKTKVYDEALAEEAKEAWQKQSQKLIKPQWQASYSKFDTDTVAATSDTVQHKIAVQKKVPVAKQTVHKKRPVAELPPPVVEAVSFFQPVRATGNPSVNTRFIACVVHGDQQVDNRKRIVLRLTTTVSVNGKEIPAGTLIYGMARLAQDRIQVVISRIGPQPVNYRVYDHTYHEDILLDEPDNVVQDASQETAYRQGMRQLGRQSVGQLPTQIASELARNLLQVTRRKQTVFLPDGYPLYISSHQPNTSQ